MNRTQLLLVLLLVLLLLFFADIVAPPRAPTAMWFGQLPAPLSVHRWQGRPATYKCDDVC